MRYTITIQFDAFYKGKYKPVPILCEQVKTLKEAMLYKSIIDESVSSALISDNVSGKLVMDLLRDSM